MNTETVNIFRFVSTQDLLITINCPWGELVKDMRVLKENIHFW